MHCFRHCAFIDMRYSLIYPIHFIRDFLIIKFCNDILQIAVYHMRLKEVAAFEFCAVVEIEC